MLYAILLMPTLFLVLALAVDVSMLQLERQRLGYALDLATVSAASAVDGVAYSQTGRLRLDAPAAAMLTREYLARNLRGLPDTPDPDAVVAAAEVAVINGVPSRDPYRGYLLDRPAVCARIHVMHHFMLLGWLGMSTTTVTVAANAEIRT